MGQEATLGRPISLIRDGTIHFFGEQAAAAGRSNWAHLKRQNNSPHGDKSQTTPPEYQESDHRTPRPIRTAYRLRLKEEIIASKSEHSS